MEKNKIEILQRLEAGEISADEALAMLGQIKDEPAPTPEPQQGHYNHMPRNTFHSHEDYEFHHAGSWVDGIVGWASELVEDITGGIKDMEVTVNIPDIIKGSYSHNKNTATYVSEPIRQGLAHLELYGKNDKIEIYGYDGDCVQISCAYNARRPGEYIQFHDNNGNISLTFDEKLIRSARVVCHVPRVHVGQIFAATKNGTILIANTGADEVQLETKSETIFLENISSKTLVVKNRNGRIKATGIIGGEVLLETTNAEIFAEDINVTGLNLKTSNASVKTANINAVHMCFSTTNAKLKLENLFPIDDFSFWETERTLEACTTNSNVKLFLPRDIGLDVEANTTGGKVTCDLPLYYTEHAVKARLRGESVNYASAARRLKALVNTTNASIKIRGK